MPKTYASMTEDELRDSIEADSREIAAIRDRKRAKAAVLNQKAAEATAARVLDGLTPGQIDAVAHAAAVRVKGHAQDAG